MGGAILFRDSSCLLSQEINWKVKSLVVYRTVENFKWLIYQSFNSPEAYQKILGNLSTLKDLDSTQNNIRGYIPSTIGQLLHIPQSLDDLISLESLDLSWNNLSGTIPKSFEALIHLKYLNVAFNKLQGAIPDGGPFENFTAESFMSNDALCGAPRLQVRACDIDSKQSRKMKMLLLKFILPFVVSAIIVVIFIVLLLKCQNKKSEVPPIQDDSSFLVTHSRISYQELLYATNYFSEDFLVGKRRLGMVYEGVLSDKLVIAIKVFNLQLEGAFKSFDAECEVIRNICHRNLVKIISSCSNLDFKVLVLEYMPNGSLEKWLYSQLFSRFDSKIKYHDRRGISIRVSP
ncbi:hypothetical protein L1049_025124 [Liquidambar formosana]|uniref:Protein kinase domain-containing protein n=1 Tax=Liquidambar formosana TaxID=63359 RepID=A0AAP0X5B9_LIQFO